jgi:F-type H+-transporting ATPase subunit b
MNLIYLVAQVPEEAVHEPGVFNLNLGVSAWTFIIFILLVVVLAKFAFPPILGYAAAREQRIQDALDQARRHREESERLLEEQRQELERARQQAQLMIAEGKAGADRVREEMLQQARLDQQEVVARGKREIEAERESAIEALRRDAIELALASAAKLVSHRIGAAEDRELVAEFLQSVDRESGAGVA